ncbi:MAG TPA: lipoprotein [Magnetospirillum sp.]|jgi:hypothetical protein|nr:lipoprotein [Magnetospirillum sp.]
MRRLTVLIMVAAMAAGLSACGRKGRPIVPEDSTYPRVYPPVSFPQGPSKDQTDEYGQPIPEAQRTAPGPETRTQ